MAIPCVNTSDSEKSEKARSDAAPSLPSQEAPSLTESEESESQYFSLRGRCGAEPEISAPPEKEPIRVGSRPRSRSDSLRTLQTPSIRSVAVSWITVVSA